MSNPVLAQAAAMLKRQGTGKDSMLIHVNPAEFKKVQKALGTKGKTNPNTGLPSFDTGDGPGGDGGGPAGNDSATGGSAANGGTGNNDTSSSSGTGTGTGSTDATNDGPGLAGESTSGNPTGVDSYGMSDALGDMVSGNLTAAEALGFAFGGIMNSLSAPTGEQMGLLGMMAPGKVGLDALQSMAVGISNATGLSDARGGPGIDASGPGDAGGSEGLDGTKIGKTKFEVSKRFLDNTQADSDFAAAAQQNAIDPKATLAGLIDKGKLKVKLPFDLLSTPKLSAFGSAGRGLLENAQVQQANQLRSTGASALGDFLAKVNGGKA